MFRTMRQRNLFIKTSFAVVTNLSENTFLANKTKLKQRCFDGETLP